MKAAHSLLPAVLALLLSACSPAPQPRASDGAIESKFVADSAAAATVANPQLYMAYERSIQLDVEQGRIQAIFEATETACRQATAEQCVVLESSLNSGQWPGAMLKLRATPSGIRKLLETLGTSGKVVSQTVTGEDLAGPITDADRRMAMLVDYRTKLEGLRGTASSNIDALIKVNQELAEVQSQIEALAGERARLSQRIETETLTVRIQSEEERAFWRPVGAALSGFGTNLAAGLSNAITALAYVLPWLILLVLFLWAWRKWRSRRR